MGNATLLALVFSLTFASSGGAADRSFAPDENGQIVFVTPSGNIGCTYIPKGGTAMYTPDDGGPELGCDRIQPLYVRLILSASGKPFIFKMEGDSACCSDANVLQYGDRWRAGPFSCTSGEAALHARVTMAMASSQAERNTPSTDTRTSSAGWLANRFSLECAPFRSYKAAHSDNKT